MISNLIIITLFVLVVILTIFSLKLYKRTALLGSNSDDKNFIKNLDVEQPTTNNNIKDIISSKEKENFDNHNLLILEENVKLKKEIENYKTIIGNIQIFTSLYSDKSLKSVCLFDNGNKQGEERLYFKGNAVLNKIKQWNNGILDGISTTFYKTGEKYIETTYKNGKLDGNYIAYNKDGSIKTSYQYKNGERIE